MAVFGAFNPNSSRAGSHPYGAAGMFAGLGDGFLKIGETMDKNDQENKKIQFQTAQEAANHAFEQNLARFKEQHEDTRAANSQAAETAREHERTASASADRAATQTRMEQDHQDQMKVEAQRLGISVQELKIRQQEADRADQRATRSDQGEARRQQSTDETARKNVTNERIRNLNDQNKQDESTIKDLQTENKGLNSDSDDFKTNAQQIAKLRGDISTRQQQASDLDKDLQQSPKGGNKSVGSDLPPDRQAVMQSYIKSGANAQDAYNQAKQLPQATIDKATGAPKKTADTDAGADQGTPSPDGSATPPTAVAAAGGTGSDFLPSASGSEAPDNASPSPDNGQTPALPGSSDDASVASSTPGVAALNPAGTGDTPGAPQDDQGNVQQPDATAAAGPDVDGMVQQLQSSPRGQGTLATLDRLAQTDNPSPVTDKLRRAAQNSLEDQFPGQDNDGFIDAYLQQQQQGPAQSDDSELS